ncbi:zinc-dependent alcohol dehydrogenase family protein [Bacillus sp. AGMB 02131]|uniref:Zinc-dependent alcohol dehydrogenase family protein n=1 Tax=Peribacillus faecalis TaxID=2772559 RepID=A0A927CYK3_9BACI|nr:zinc-dependent alcohol dehydrogenase family protein [Peribacillus faecalis]MBD3110053.1 zinc-dependent alcohol dehydrogenase family protein [Peribacillus faecalis]
MRAAQIIEQRKPLRIGNVPDPTPGPHDVIVKVEASGVCRSDWHAWMGDWAWIGLSPVLPIIPGHELGGVVEEVGKEVKNFRPGDRVTTPFHEGCTHCSNCLSGHSNRCDNLQIFGFSYDGAYAEYVKVPNGDFNLVPLPDEVDALTAAAIGCRYMTGYHGVIRSNVRPGNWIVVHGAGGVGLSAIQVANAVGAQVIAVDVDDAKLDKAMAEGAVIGVNARKDNVVEAIMEITKGGAHASIEALGIQETILNSVLSLRKGGRHVQIGLTTSNESGFVGLPVDVITAKELEVVGSLGNPRSDYNGLLAMIAQGKLNPKSLVSREISLDNVSDVLNDMSNYKTYGFNVITKFN